MRLPAIRFSAACIAIPLASGLLVLALFLASERTLSLGTGFPLDDSWIHAVFARNVAEGRGFCFNPGESIGTSTAPLWTLAMAAVYAPTHQMVWGAKVLGSLLYLGGIILAALLTLRLTGGNAAAAALAAVLTTLLRWNAWGAVSGMEVPLFVFLSLSGLYFYVAAARSSHARGLELGSTACLGLAALARPECLMLCLATFLMAVTGELSHRPRAKELPRQLGLLGPHLLLLAVIVAPFALYNYKTIGTWVPNTFNAKVDPSGLLFALAAQDAKLALESLFVGPLEHVPILILRLLATNAILLPFALLGCYQLWSRSPERCPRGRLLPAACLLYPLGMSLVEPWARLAYRYSTILFVLYGILGAVGFSAAWNFVTSPTGGEAPHQKLRRFIIAAGGIGVLGCAVAASTQKAWWPPFERLLVYFTDASRAAEVGRVAFAVLRPALLLLAVLLTVLAMMAFKMRLRGLVVTLGVLCLLSQGALAVVAARRYAIEVKNINQLHVACGEWIDQNLPRDATLALDDIGAITYLSRRRVVDMVGLVSLEAIAFRRAGRSRIEFLREVQPDFVATIRPEILEEHPLLFRPIHEISIDDNISSLGSRIVVFETPWGHGRPDSPPPFRPPRPTSR